MFLGETLGLQRYDVVRRDIFMELADKQHAQLWKHDEINLTKDRMDYEMLSPTEKFVFESNLRWQSGVDSMLFRSIKEILKYITSPELELCCGYWSAFENIHSRSYTWILQSICKNPAKFFDSIFEDEAIVKRMEFAKRAYDELIKTRGEQSLKDEIFEAIVATYITEGISFYISFACTLYFKYRGKMVGNGSIIQLIERDEALHVAITQNILKIWKADSSEGFQEIYKKNEQRVYDMVRAAVESEKKWAEYLFSKGDLPGFNANLLSGYAEWLANTRLVSLGLKKIYDQKSNPIGGWLDTFSDSSRIQAAPQETEIIRYEIGALNKDIKDDDFNDFDLG